MGNIFCTKVDKEKEALILGAKSPKEAVVLKLQNSVYKDKFRGNEEMLNRLAACLSDVDEIKESYLISDWIETVKYFRQLEDGVETSGSSVAVKTESPDEETEMKDEKGGRGLISIPEQSLPEGVPEKPKPSVLEDDDDNAVSEIDIREASQDPNVKLANQVKIKIIVSEVAHTQGKKNFRKFISPILSKFDFLPELGMFHSALMIGPWLVEWNNSALCIPRKCVSRAALLSADVDALDTKLEVETVISRLAEVIVKWNSCKLYHDTDKDKKKYGNCQDFVHDVLNHIGIDCNFGGPLQKFLENLRETGNEKLVFHMDDPFREKFKFDEKKKEFSNHKELDIFVNELLAKVPEFQSEFKQEYGFLKSFDRAFWLKHFKFEKNLDWKPAMTIIEDEDGEDEELACPFKNPLETYSVRFLQ